MQFSDDPEIGSSEFEWFYRPSVKFPSNHHPEWGGAGSWLDGQMENLKSSRSAMSMVKAIPSSILEMLRCQRKES